MTSWLVQPKKFIGAVTGTHKEMISKKAVRILARLINDTPKDTGHAAANWLPTIAEPSQETSSGTEYAGLVGKAQTMFDPRGLPAFPILFLTNNVKYISVLNYGRPAGHPHSVKAPLHFVEAAINSERGT